MDRIITLREQIDIIDNEIMKLLEDRFALSIQIGNRKLKSNINVLDTNREQTIIDKASKHNHSPAIESIYRCIMEESKKLQRK